VFVPSADAACSAVYEQLPPTAYSCFFTTVLVLRELLAEGAADCSDVAAALARVWFQGRGGCGAQLRGTRLLQL
jgi:hypothetical protein